MFLVVVSMRYVTFNGEGHVRTRGVEGERTREQKKCNKAREKW